MSNTTTTHNADPFAGLRTPITPAPVRYSNRIPGLAQAYRAWASRSDQLRAHAAEYYAQFGPGILKVDATPLPGSVLVGREDAPPVSTMYDALDELPPHEGPPAPKLARWQMARPQAEGFSYELVGRMGLRLIGHSSDGPEQNPFAPRNHPRILHAPAPVTGPIHDPEFTLESVDPASEPGSTAFEDANGPLYVIHGRAQHAGPPDLEDYEELGVSNAWAGCQLVVARYKETLSWAAYLFADVDGRTGALTTGRVIPASVPGWGVIDITATQTVRATPNPASFWLPTVPAYSVLAARGSQNEFSTPFTTLSVDLRPAWPHAS